MFGPRLMSNAGYIAHRQKMLHTPALNQLQITCDVIKKHFSVPVYHITEYLLQQCCGYIQMPNRMILRVFWE